VNDCCMEAIPVQRRVMFEEGMADTHLDLVRSSSGLPESLEIGSLALSSSLPRTSPQTVPLHHRAKGHECPYFFGLSWSSSWIRPSLAGQVWVGPG
jgi:hypothetical protein